jgi:hypothetical protein
MTSDRITSRIVTAVQTMSATRDSLSLLLELDDDRATRDAIPFTDVHRADDGVVG